MLALNPLSTGGAQIGLYKNPLAVIKDRRDASGQLIAKKLAAPPDLTLKDPDGRPLVINPQTLAFSQGGSWLVAETLEGSFVRMDLNTLGIKPFAPAYGSTGSPALLKSQVAVSENGRWVAIANGYAGQFKVYDLAGCGPAPDCPSYDYWPFAASKIPGLRNIIRVRFVNDGLISFEALSSDGSRNGTYGLAPSPSITSLTDYIGLGDSYTSGEGAFDYVTGTDTPENTCHQSVNSYPLLLARDLFGGAGGHSAACSGAVIDDIGSTSDRYKGQVKAGSSLDELRRGRPQALEAIETGFLPGYVAQHRFVQRWQPRITTVSIAGNDIGFGDILRNCVAPHISLRHGGNTCYNTYEDRLELKNLVDRTVPRWEALFAQLRKEAPGTRLYVIGYPQIALSSGNCALNVRLDRDELELAAELIDYINHDVAEAAHASGAAYVDISRALYGHRLCEARSYAVAVNGLTAGNDFGAGGIGLLGRESYHPNALGQELMEQSILRQTHNLDAAEQSGKNGAPGGMGAALLNAPRTGRVVYDLLPDHGLVPETGKRGSPLAVRADGAKDGLRANTAYDVRLDGPSGRLLGRIISDDTGNINASVRIPEDIVPGSHRIDMIGRNLNDEPLDVTAVSYVRASDADSDGDGVDDVLVRPVGASGSGNSGKRSGKPNPKTADRAIRGTVRTVSKDRNVRSGSSWAWAWGAGAAITGLLLLTVGKINKNRRSGLQ
jgi:hypothetical protein